MTKIDIYDAEYKRIKEICRDYRITTADLIESVIDLICDAVKVTDFEEYTKYEQAFGEGDVVIWNDEKYIVHEVIQEEDDSYTYFVVASGTHEPKCAEVPQDELKGA